MMAKEILYGGIVRIETPGGITFELYNNSNRKLFIDKYMSDKNNEKGVTCMWTVPPRNSSDLVRQIEVALK